jgi:HEAT repeat protein
MADTTTKKLLRLLEPDQPLPLRRAAALVLGEVGTKDRELTDALSAQLADPDPDMRIQIMQTVGKLHIESALSQLLERVKAGGPEADVAAQAAACLGARGIHALQELMGQTAPGLRRRIAGALAAGRTPTAENAAVETLLDTDPGVVDAAARTLLGQVRTLTDSQRRAVVDRALELLQPRKKGAAPPPHSLAALVRLLAAIGDARAEKVYWTCAEPGHPAELRAAALQALGSLPADRGAASLKRLMAFAADPDFRIAAPALMMLKGLPVHRKNLADWLALFDAPDIAARRLAMEKLAEQDVEPVAEALLAQLRHPDRNLRDEALRCLAKLEHGRAALADQLLAAATPEEAWTLARAQASLVRDYSAGLRTKLFNRACTHLEKEDRRADALLFVLREADPRELRDKLAERALAYRKKKQYPTALIYLRLLGRDPACGEALRFEQAACGVKVSVHDLAPAARAADPCLAQFARLIHSHDTPPLTYVEKASWLEPEDLFYLGFHFAEGTGPERDFGGELLHLLLKKAPKSKLARDARAKLRGAGLD